MRKTYINILIASVIIFSIISCIPTEKEDRKTSGKVNVEKAHKLLNVADSILKQDSVFWSKVMSTNVSIAASADRLIRQKLDSAILLAPHDKKAYIRKYNYLIACRKDDGLLPLLVQMERQCDSIEGDFLCLKALLEYHNGDSINGQKSFYSADKAFQAQIDQCSPDDSLRYGSLRLSKALNQSLMKNDFSIFRNELKVFQKVFPSTGTSSMDALQNMNSREEYYLKIFPGR